MIRKRILILDDDYDILDSLTTLFEYENCTIVTLSQLFTIDVIEDIRLLNPDVILLDINFGKHNGMDICLRLKDNPDTCKYKIILISAGKYAQVAFQSKCDFYIQKPFDLEHLIALVCSPK
ncbi:two-component system response regulator [Pedobacter lithocola]|uniref:Two-component system response regulator n=1 Tax=Pedobacter lithocola TaxID=1908239 RepID=A0ABV8PCC6_9SPHI